MKLIKQNKRTSILLGAAFLMATSSIGPGFMLQTAAFTAELKAEFGFAIVLSIIFSIIAQLNVWTIISVSDKRGQDIANQILPGLGYVVAFLVALGGLIFNIGNIGGASMALHIVAGIDINIGAAISGIITMLLFILPKAENILDGTSKIMGMVMIALIGFIAYSTHPPVKLAITHTIMPDYIPWLATLTLIGGTVGGYITFSGGHRLIDANITGKENLHHVRQSAFWGILIDAFVRVLLFLAVLGVVTSGAILDPKDPIGSTFLIAAGSFGYMIFGIIFLCASLTSILGAAYTSISFCKTLFPIINKYEKSVIVLFIAISTFILIFIGKPVSLMIVAGTVNGFILPITLSVMLIATRRKDIVGDYLHPKVLYYLGWVVVLITAYIAVISVHSIFKLF